MSYYGSPLNEFVANNCKKKMIVMNIDLAMYDKVKKKIRIIESKHETEFIGKSQREFLKLLPDLFNNSGEKIAFVWR